MVIWKGYTGGGGGGGIMHVRIMHMKTLVIEYCMIILLSLTKMDHVLLFMPHHLITVIIMRTTHCSFLLSYLNFYK